MVRVRRFGVAFVATAVVALGSIQPAFAQESTPPPDTSGPEPPAATTPPPPAEPTEPEPAPGKSEPAPQEPPTESEPAPSADSPEDAAPAPADTTESDGEAADAEPADSDAKESPKDVVKLEDAPPPAPKVPAEVQPAPKVPAEVQPAPKVPAEVQPAPVPEPTETAGASAGVVVSLQIKDTPVTPATTAADPAADADAADAAVEAIVSLRFRAAAPIALMPTTESVDEGPSAVRTITAARTQLARPQACARPTARVPLSARCKQVRAIATLRVTLTYLSNPGEVRAAIARGPARVTIRRIEARPPPNSKAAKKRPVAEARPIVPFGYSGQGVTNDGFNGSSGSSSSSRLFALAVVPLRVPWPFRFARLRLPTTLPHGVIPAPPSARPG